jgi:hypothetical protein
MTPELASPPTDALRARRNVPLKHRGFDITAVLRTVRDVSGP